MAWKFKNKQILVTSDFDINSNKLININNPSENQDAATKYYVDNAILNSGGTWYLRDSSDNEANITANNYIKFSQTTTIQTVFIDNTHGTSGDPYEISFSVRSDSIGATQLNVSGNGTSGQILSSNGTGGFNWINNDLGSVTNISAGNGMDFSDITTTGSVILGTPSDITSGSTSSVSSTSHSHYINSNSLVVPNGGIIVNNDNQFQLDTTYIVDSVIPGLTKISGITSNSDLGTLSSGLTLGMVYIENIGSVTAYVNLGTTVTGNEINPYGEIEVLSGEIVSITVNKRLSNTQTEHIYVNSSSWTNVELNVDWAEITYKNQSNEIDPSALPIATSSILGAVKIGANINATGDGTISIDDPLSTINELTDVNITTPSNDQVLKYDNGNWVNGDAVTSLSGLTDTDINSPQESQTLVYSGGTWINRDAVASLVDLTDTTISNPQENQTLVYSGGTWVNGSAGAGGFLGNVTKNSPEPSDPQANQWVQPEPQPDGTFNYTFDNFEDSGSNPINVNLSLEDVKLRYSANGYWVKESFNKPLTSGKTWIGTTNNEAQEVSVIEEWVTSEESLTYIGQKFPYDTQTLFKTDLDEITTLQNFVFIENINLKTVANTLILSVPSGKKMLFNRCKLIILNNASPTSFTISIGDNGSSYNNIVDSTTIDDVLIDETYDLQIGTLTYPRQSIAVDSNVYFRVSSGSTNAGDLYAHLLIEGFVY